MSYRPSCCYCAGTLPPCPLTRSLSNELARIRVIKDTSQVLVTFQEAFQLVRARGMTQLAQGLRFDLADTLAGDVELLADLFQRMVGRHFDAETHAQYLRLTRGQRIEHVLHDAAHRGVQRGVGRRQRVVVLDEVAEVRIVVVADWRLHRNRLFGDLHDLTDLISRHLHLDGQGRRIWLGARFLQDLTRNAVHLVDRFDHMHGNTDGAGLVGDRTGDGLAYPPRCIGRKLVAATVFELVHRFHQADVALLDQIEELQAAVGVFLGDRNDQAQVGLGHFALGLARLHFTSRHLAVDVAQIRQRQHDARLQIDQALLQLFDGRNVATENGAVGMASLDLAVDPFEVGFIAREDFDEVGARHAALVDGHVEDLFLDVAHFIDLPTQGVAQLFDHLGGEADAQQLVGDRFLCLDIGFRVVAVFFEGLAHLVELQGDDVELLQRRIFQRFQLFGREAGGARSARFFLFFGFLFFLFFLVLVFFRRAGHYRRIVVFIDQTIDNFVDLDFIGADPVRCGDNFGDRHGTGRDRLYHVFQAIFDAFGDLDLAFARQQLDRTYFAHIHAHRIGGAAEVGVDRRQGRLGGRLGLVVAGDGGDVVRQQQRLGVRRVLVDGDAHVVEGADDAFDRFRIDDVLGQMVVDLGIGEEAAFLAELDQGFQFLAAAFEFFLGRLRVRRESVLQQRLFLGLAVLGLGLVDGLQLGAFNGVERGHFVVLGLEFLGLAAAPSRHFDRWQHVSRRVDRGQRCRVRRLAHRRRIAGDASFRFIGRFSRFCGHFGGLCSRIGFRFLDWHRRFRLHNDLRIKDKVSCGPKTYVYGLADHASPTMLTTYTSLGTIRGHNRYLPGLPGHFWQKFYYI